MNRSHRTDSAMPRRRATESARPFLFACLVLVGAILVVFGPICAHGFVSFDDPLHLHNNPHLNPPTFSGLWNLWRAPYKSEYVPLSYTFYAVEAWLAQLPPEEYGG